MKIKHLLNLLLAFALAISNSYAQESSNASGGDASGSGGTVAYSIGQTFYTYQSSSNGNTNHGVQQPYLISAVGIDEGISTISLITYPNPTSDYLLLELFDYSNEKIDYQLIDLKGKIILNGSINNAQAKVDLNAYSKGIYFIKVFKQSEEIKTFKIIKN
jgi:opacity protein-like surface antigen